MTAPPLGVPLPERRRVGLVVAAPAALLLVLGAGVRPQTSTHHSPATAVRPSPSATALPHGGGQRRPVVAAVAGAGPVTTGRLAVSISHAHPAGFALPIAGLAPGDTSERLVDLVDTGDVHPGRISMRLTSSPRNALTAPGRASLRGTWLSCPTAWQVDKSGPHCTNPTVLSSGGILAPVATVAAQLGLTHTGATAHLLLRVHLPQAAGNEMQGLSCQLTVHVIAIQGDA